MAFRRTLTSALLIALIGHLCWAGQATETSSQQDPWSSTDLISPKDLAGKLSRKESKPAIIYVGFPALYRASHIPGALLAGPASEPAGLEQLKKAVHHMRPDQHIVIYCGCCPYYHCPNIRPAWKTLHAMGFKNLKVLYLETNLRTDWISKGYPAERAGHPL